MTKDNQALLNLCYVLLAVIFGFVLYKTLFFVGARFGWAERYDEWYPMASLVSSLFLGVSGVYWLASSAERSEYYLNTIAESKKVRWPTFPDTKKMTVVVVIVVAVFSVILSVFDLIWTKLLQFMLPS